VNDENAGQAFGRFLIGPVGAGFVWLLLAPLGGCKVALGVQESLQHLETGGCPNDQQLNIFGSTLGGLVGPLDFAGATGVGIVVGFLIFSVASSVQNP
jgi:hypothetical protein